VETIEARSARYHGKIDPHLHRSLHQMVLVLEPLGDAVRHESAVARLFTAP
jgi:hypothetical protein